MPKNSLDSTESIDLLTPEVSNGNESLPTNRCHELYRIMVRSRVVEERMIKMSKSGQGHFWIGGPGEEAFNACLGLQVHKGKGPAFDYLHLHYRNCALMVAMGMPLIEAVRIMAMTATDTHTLGRNFASHFANKDWNVIPVTSVIEVQYVMAPGTAHVQKRFGGTGLSLVMGGDAGSAEGDFASCLIWSSRPGNELPVLMVVTNNQWGISTPACSVHAEQNISDRGKPFGIPGETVDGNDPIASWHAISRAMSHCREERKPFLLEGMVSRLNGHSSSSGAVRNDEPDCIEMFEQKMLECGAIDQQTIDSVRVEAEAEVHETVEQVLQEPQPTADDIHRHTYADSDVDSVYPGDYTGLPR